MNSHLLFLSAMKSRKRKNIADLPSFCYCLKTRQKHGTHSNNIMKNLFMFETFSMINEMTFIFQGQADPKWPLFKIY